MLRLDPGGRHECWCIERRYRRRCPGGRSHNKRRCFNQRGSHELSLDTRNPLLPQTLSTETINYGGEPSLLSFFYAQPIHHCGLVVRGVIKKSANHHQMGYPVLPSSPMFL
jgi:hypothetical protein